MRSLFRRIVLKIKSTRGQSFLELALVLPILLLMLLGLVELTFFMGRYLDILDLSKEAARFASMRDPFSPGSDLDCSTTNDLNFYYDSSCMLSPPAGSAACTESQYCNGFNPLLTLNLATDDVVITAFTIAGHEVSDQWPEPNSYWALSNVDFANDVDLNFNSNPGHPDRFKYDCKGNAVRTEPYYTDDRIEALMLDTSPGNKGYITVEVYYCYVQVLGLPIISDILPNPMQVHAYALMPLPAAQPTPTPIP